MKNITNHEMTFALKVLKNPEKNYNANNISSLLGITPMGALKIAKRLEKEQIIIIKQLGKAKFFKFNFYNDYAKDFAKLLLKREAIHAGPYIKRWVAELQKVKNADMIILFGSVLIKKEKAGDIDVLLATNQKKFYKLKKEIKQINDINLKKIHPIYQSLSDLKQNIKKEDEVILNSIKGIIIKGEEIFVEALK